MITILLPNDVHRGDVFSHHFSGVACSEAFIRHTIVVHGKRDLFTRL
jgi:hypothetical protein